MPNDLQPGMMARYWPQNQFYRRVMTENIHKPDSDNLPACEDIRMGNSWTAEIRIVIPGTLEPYRLETCIFFSDGKLGNLLLKVDKTCWDQGLEIIT